MINGLTFEKSGLQYMKEKTVSFKEMMLALAGQFEQLSHVHLKNVLVSSTLKTPNIGVSFVVTPTFMLNGIFQFL